MVFITVDVDADFAQAARCGRAWLFIKGRLVSDLLATILAALANRRFVSPIVRLDETKLTFPYPR